MNFVTLFNSFTDVSKTSSSGPIQIRLLQFSAFDQDTILFVQGLSQSDDHAKYGYSRDVDIFG